MRFGAWKLGRVEPVYTCPVCKTAATSPPAKNMALSKISVAVFADREDTRDRLESTAWDLFFKCGSPRLRAIGGYAAMLVESLRLSE